MGQNQSKEYQIMMKQRAIDAIKKAMPAKPTSTAGKGAAFAKSQRANMLLSYQYKK